MIEQDMTVAQAYLQTLLHLYEIMQDPDNWYESGLCDMVQSSSGYRDDFMSMLKEDTIAWPRFSGVAAFPVPHATLTPYDAFMAADENDMWDRNVSEYAEARWQLLEHLIECAKRRVNKEREL